MKNVLVLDKAYMPVNVVNAKKAFTYIVREKAIVVEEGNGERLKSESLNWQVPSVIRLSDFTGLSSLSKVRVIFNKRTLLERDRYRCQYCNKALSGASATVDHVVPKSKQGKTGWDNCVISCIDCNAKKGNKDLAESGMALRKPPKSPHYLNHLNHVLERHLKDSESSWKRYFIL